MVFKLVILVYMLSGGQPTGEPPLRFENRAPFATVEECKGYLSTEEGAARYNAFTNALAKAIPEGRSITITHGCEQMEDNSI